MPGNTFGKLFRLTTFGESHGLAIGGIIDGCPAGLELDINLIQKELNRRKPGQSEITTQRKEEDKIEILSGLLNNISLGTPISFIIKNKDGNPKDYTHIKQVFRPSHADYTYYKKYGIRDARGGGRSSARETIARVVGGAVARQILKKSNISFSAYVSRVGDVKCPASYKDLDIGKAEESMVRCPDKETADKMIQLINEVKVRGDTVGGVITCIIKNVPAGIGEPVFEKLHAELGKAMLSINAAKGFELGSGFSSASMLGSEHNDIMENSGERIKMKTNFSGGIQGGISNGEDIFFNVAFKPVSTLMQHQNAINENGEKVIIEGKGRHDPCVVPRAVPIVEAMAALVIMDYYLQEKGYNFFVEKKDRLS